MELEKVLNEKSILVNQLEERNRVLLENLKTNSEVKNVSFCAFKPEKETLRDKKAIYTAVRIKPSQNVDRFKWKTSSTKNTLTLLPENEASSKQYTCDHIFAPSKNNNDVFGEIKPFLETTMEGSDTCIVTYGSSGSGKSYTMIGNEFEPGIVLKLIDYILINGKKTI